MKHSGCLLDDSYGEIKLLPQPLAFNCNIKGRKLKAEVIAEIRNPLNWYYRIKFSDGYTSDFYASQSGTWYDAANDDKSKPFKSPYVFAIQNDLKDIVCFNTSDAHYCFQLPVAGVETNVFVFFSNSDEFGPLYIVRYNGDYRFTLKRKGK